MDLISSDLGRTKKVIKSAERQVAKNEGKNTLYPIVQTEQTF